jgi:O-antigen ligase
MKWLLFVYFCLSGVTWVAGKAGAGISGRVALPDVTMLVLILVLLLRNGGSLYLPRLVLAGGVLMLAFGPGILVSQDPSSSLVEWMVHVFGLLGFFVIYNFAARGNLDQRLDVLTLWVRGGVVLAFIGFYDLAAATIGLPGLAASLGQAPTAQGGLVGTFRNTGQAGTFFVTVLTTAIPLYRVSTGRRRQEMVIWSAVLVLATVLTVKRSALVALVLGMFLLLLSERSWRGRMRTLAVSGAAVAIVVPAFLWLQAASPQFRWRLESKITSSVAADRLTTFADQNVEATLNAFMERPITGVGAGGVAGIYTAKYEIHSTYLSVLTSAGVLGALAYVWFMVVLFRSCTRPRNGDPRARAFARATFPLMLALMAMYAYTYHLRKREFWVVSALSAAVMAPVAAASGGRRPPALRTPLREPVAAGSA